MRITWDQFENRPYSSGLSQAVLYLEDAPGIPWNGLISVSEGGDPAADARYFDGQRYFNRNTSSPFAGTISAYTYPDEFESYAGADRIFTGQPRKPFAFTYRTNHEIHIVYSAIIAPSKRVYASLGGKVEPVAFEWNFTTQPQEIPGGKPSAHLVILIDESPAAALSNLEAALYGDDENDPLLPSVLDVIDIFESSATLQITDNGDGSWTATGPDEVVYMLDESQFHINWPSVVILDSITYKVSSL